MDHSTGRTREKEKLHFNDGAGKSKVTSRTGVEGEKKEEIVFLQLSDIHLDRQYSEVRCLLVAVLEYNVYCRYGVACD